MTNYVLLVFSDKLIFNNVNIIILRICNFDINIIRTDKSEYHIDIGSGTGFVAWETLH